MHKFIKSAATAVLSCLALAQSAHANGFPVPEPDSIALVGLAMGIAVWISRRNRKK